MPYVKKDNRKELQTTLDDLVSILHNLEDKSGNTSRAGNLNYIVTYLINEMYPVNKYSELNDAVGFLECCKLELYRRRVGPYEDVAIKNNGDMSNYPAINTKKKSFFKRIFNIGG